MENSSTFLNTTMCPSRESLPTPFAIFLMTHFCMIIAILGIPANVFALLVLRRDPSKTTTRFLLMVLAVEDLLLIFLYVVYYVAPNYIYFHNFKFLLYIKLFDSVTHFFTNWIKMTEIYTVLLVTLDRFIAIHYPLKAVSLCRVSNARRALITIAAVSFLVKLPNEIINANKMVWREECNDYLPDSYFIDKSWYKMAMLINKNIVDQILAYIIPSIILIVFNTLLIIRIRKADSERQGLEETKACVSREPTTYSSHGNSHVEKSSSRVSQRRNITITLICVITIFLICETPTTLIYIINIIRICTKVDKFATEILANLYCFSLILMFVNCASNFFVYVLIGRKFRNLFLRLFCRQSPCCFPPEQRQSNFSRWDKTTANYETGYQRSVFQMKTTRPEVNGSQGTTQPRPSNNDKLSPQDCNSSGITECYLSTV